MALKDYRKKRDFKVTAEPSGKKRSNRNGQLEFVVQEHHARRLHYDFRLEVEGVLKSWAIPKGPSLDPSEKRLAIQVEDHPFEYRTFEGTIPKGSYGAGTVEIWDKGTYLAEGAKTSQESERLMQKGLENGHLNFILNGHKLKGAFSLIRLHGGETNQWLFFKKKDEYAHSSLSTKKARDTTPKQKSSSSINTEENPTHAEMPTRVKPMLATLVNEPFDAKDWIFEIKWDGYRALAEVRKENVHLYSRNFQSFDHRFPALVEDLQTLQVNALLDGEIVVLDAHHKPSFQLIQNYQKTQSGTLVYYVFDLLYLEGYDIRHLPLIERKKILKKLLPKTSHLHFCQHIKAKGKAFFKSALKKGYEGIIAKTAESPYVEGRSRYWLKIKTHQRQEAIICGFTSPQGAREKFGSLLLGVYDQNELVYVGHTGSGFDRKKLMNIYEKLQPLIQSKSPFKSSLKLSSQVTWVKPHLVCEVKFAEWTDEGRMRQAIFLGMREDKKGKEVVREKTFPVDEVLENDTPQQHAKAVKSIEKNSSDDYLTHLDKIYWPDEGYTKGDLIQYYRQVSPFILPYLINRPEVLKRYPNGIKEASFYQKEADKMPKWIRTEVIQHDEKQVQYLVIEDEKSLLYTVNLGCIDLNPFNSRLQSLYTPDYLIIDLDPEDVPFAVVIDVAQAVHAVLKEWKIPSVCKTSGATGLHIYIPTGAQYTYEEVKQFAKLIGIAVHQRLPDVTSLVRNPHKRQKKVYLDYLQNNFGQTVAAPYSVRPLPGAPVSTPLKWSEVKAGLNPSEFTMKTVLRRFKKVGDLFKPVLGKGINLRSILKKIKI
jgi:bifunctional non-homologous end joining protein LigD